MRRARRLGTGPHVRSVLVALSTAALGLATMATPSSAASASPHWSIVAETTPTHFAAGDEADAYVLIVRNDGGAPTKAGETVTITDALPSGVILMSATAQGEGADGHGEPEYDPTCSRDEETDTATCTYGESTAEPPVLPGAVIEMTVIVSIPTGVTALGPDTGTVEGGGASSASTSVASEVDPAPAPFGMRLLDLDNVDESGEADTQAGSHPYELTTTLMFSIVGRQPEGRRPPTPLAAAAPKDVQAALPAGLVGDPNAVPRCSQAAFLEHTELNCPLDTQVGTIKPFFYGTFHTAVFPVYDLVPPPGEPAELGFSVGKGHVVMFLDLRGNGEYGLTADLNELPEVGPLQGAALTLWGVPAASSHDLEREGTDGDGPLESRTCQPSFVLSSGKEEATECPSGAPLTPFLTLPTKCQSTSLQVSAEYDSWEQPEQLDSFPGEANPGPGEATLAQAITGCERLSFSPTIAFTPETTEAAKPSGYTLDLHVPQDEDPNGLATPALHRVVVSLPAGLELSPSVANGLRSCSPAQFEVDSTATAACPLQSRIGTVKIATPLLSTPLEGDLYVGQPACAPCTPADAQGGRLLRLYLQAQGSGITVKLEGSAHIDQSTGQVTVSFAESPQLPFEDVKLTLDGGANALLVNPDECGAQLFASSQLTPYSSEAPAEPASPPFTLEGCRAPQFQPSFVAGTTNNQAGAFSPLTLTLSRVDADEQLQSLSVRLPAGLLAMLGKVPPCPESQAEAGACAAQSRIGSVTVGAGPGADPLYLEGSVYLTGPYDGAPYGLSIVVPAQAGPFDLGQIVLGARIAVDPATAALTVTSDPLPQSLDGIPLQIRTVHLDIDREGFVFNPTDCRALAIAGAATSTAGASAALSSRFQAANCATLPFKPRLTALMHAHTSKAAGADLHVRIVSSAGQANIATLELQLPRSLSSRLSALQHSCRVSAFDANPAVCPSASIVGSASVISPALPYPLVGPVYAVSHGGAALPTVALVLQGDGVVVRLEGQTRVKRGVTTETFASLPDVPISRVDVKLPSGPHSLLAATLPAKAHGSLCGRRLAMPTQITGHNGAVAKQTTIISVSGCRRPRRRRRK